MKLFALPLTYLVAFMTPIAVNAHPHNWISLKTEFTINDKGQLTGVLQHWQFDVYYSAIRLDEIKKGYAQQQQGLDAIAKEMAENLGSFDYFSELKIDSMQIKLPMPNTASLNPISENAQQVLMLTMQFQLKKPQAIS